MDNSFSRLRNSWINTRILKISKLYIVTTVKHDSVTLYILYYSYLFININ